MATALSKEQIISTFGLSNTQPAVMDGVESYGSGSGVFKISSPVDGKELGKNAKASKADYEKLVKTSQAAFKVWRTMPAPKRGEIVRQYGDTLRDNKDALGALVSWEMGKSLQEGLGEVQEMIDICDFAVGLSRQLYGLSMHSERSEHRMYEQWHPIGVVGIISAFNFPVAVWAWNSMVAAVCGNVSIWKPSEKTPLTAAACMQLWSKVAKANNLPAGLMSTIVGDVAEIGETLISDKRVGLVSATGSTRMGRRVAEVVGSRLGKSLLELGGNNAIILTKNSNLKLSLPAIVFGAVGTCGQRCTSTRRLLVPENMFDQVKETILGAYKGLKIGSPLDTANHVGPLIDKDAVAAMQASLSAVKEQGGEVVYGGEPLSGSGYESGCYVTPAVAVAKNEMAIVQHETFAPILYLIPYAGGIDSAIEMQNNVPQGLSSAIFTDKLQEAEQFLSAAGSDCGIANINIGTSGAEIGGAFGGEKDTGGGRESGSDSWKAYMRRQTNTINYGDTLPLAQGIKFDL